MKINKTIDFRSKRQFSYTEKHIASYVIAFRLLNDRISMETGKPKIQMK